MLTDKQRRRGMIPPPIKVKDAFADNDEVDETDADLVNGSPPQPVGRSTFRDFQPITPNNPKSIEPECSYHRDFFTVHNTTVEVELDHDVLTWRNVSAHDVSNGTSRKKSPNQNEGESIDLHNVYAITPILAQGTWSLNVNDSVAGTAVTTMNSIGTSRSMVPPSPTTPLRGFQLHTCQTIYNSMLQELLIIFQNNSPALIDQWYQMLSKKIAKMRPPRHVLVMCNPYSGARHSRHTYGTKIKPIFEQAQYKVTYTEISDHYSADEALAELDVDFDSIDGLVIIGGDGSVINVINALIRYLAKQNRTRLDIDEDLPALPFPLCIVAEGTTNLICESFQGNTDPHTPILHLMFDRRMKIDMSAIFDGDCNFVSANFCSGSGYAATALKYFPRYSLHSPKTVIKKSFSKAASKKNLRPVRMEIRYVPANQTSFSSDRCYRGCSLCTPEVSEKCDDQVTVFDDSHLQERNRKKKNLSIPREPSVRSSSAGRRNLRLSSDSTKNWKTLEDEYLQVLVLTNAGLWSFAPQGLSKFGHLADGVLDLILIQPTTRKEFLRYVKRNGNSKNQFDFSFVQTLRVKEVEIIVRNPSDLTSDWLNNAENADDSTPSDESSNEDLSDVETKSSIPRTHHPHPPSAPISEDSRRHRRPHHRISDQSQQMNRSIDATKMRQAQSETEGENPSIDPMDSTTSLRRSGIFQTLKSKADKISLPRPFSGRTKDPDDEKSSKKAKRPPSGASLRPSRSLLSLFNSGQSTTSTRADPSTPSTNSRRESIIRRPSIMSRSSSIDNDKLATMKATSRLKKQECLWNLDFTPYNSPMIRLKCFYRYLPVFGVGIESDARPREVNYSCFGRMG